MNDMDDQPRSEASQRQGSRRRRLFGCAAALFTVVLSLGALELISQMILWGSDEPRTRSKYESRWPGRLYQRDNELGKVQRPDVSVTTTNEMGQDTTFTTDEHGLRIGADRSRAPLGHSVAVLGDSFIQAAVTPFEDTFCEALSRRLGGEVVYNLGVGGYSPRQTVDFGKRVLPELDVDTLILAVYAGNDLRDDYLWTGRYIPREVVEPSIFDRSALYRLIRDGPPEKKSPLFQGYDWNWHFDAELLLYDPELAPEDAAKMEQAKAKSLASLEAFKTLAAQRGARPLIVFIPTKAMVYQEPLFISCTTITPWAWDAIMGVQRRGLNFDQVRETWRTLAEQAQLPLLDLTDEFRAQRGSPLYGKIDRHWSATGQRIAADIVAAYLEEHSYPCADGK